MEATNKEIFERIFELKTYRQTLVDYNDRFIHEFKTTTRQTYNTALWRHKLFEEIKNINARIQAMESALTTGNKITFENIKKLPTI